MSKIEGMKEELLSIDISRVINNTLSKARNKCTYINPLNSIKCQMCNTVLINNKTQSETSNNINDNTSTKLAEKDIKIAKKADENSGIINISNEEGKTNIIDNNNDNNNNDNIREHDN